MFWLTLEAWRFMPKKVVDKKNTVPTGNKFNLIFIVFLIDINGIFLISKGGTIWKLYFYKKRRILKSVFKWRSSKITNLKTLDQIKKLLKMIQNINFTCINVLVCYGTPSWVSSSLYKELMYISKWVIMSIGYYNHASDVFNNLIKLILHSNIAHL